MSGEPAGAFKPSGDLRANRCACGVVFASGSAPLNVRFLMACNDSRMQVPDVRYARSNDLRLAYQQWGAGPRLLLVPALVSNMEVSWEHEYIVRIYEMMGRHVEVVQFDKRGIGLSDRTEVAPTLEGRIGDIVAVMADGGWGRAIPLG